VNPAVAALAASGCFVAAAWGWSMTRDQGPRNRFGQADDDLSGTEIGPGLVSRLWAQVCERLAGPMLTLMTVTQKERIRARLDQAGRPMTLRDFAGRKGAVVASLGLVGLVFVVKGNPVVLVIALLGGWLWLDLWLITKAKRRQARIERDLPDFLDVLAITTGAGVAFRPAIARVGEALGGPLHAELGATMQQMEIGASRRSAFEAFRQRNPVPSVTQFVTALLQAEELGTPLVDALQDLAREARREFHQNARRRAARAAPRVSLIVTTLVVPGSIMLIVAALFLGSNLHLGKLLGPTH
jgi:tight adherence protein C